jgi:hypothetical protein
LAKSSKESDEIEAMFSQDDKFFNKLLNTDKLTLTDEQYVNLKIQQNKNFFNVDRGHQAAKKANLGDIKSTKIESPFILNHTLFELSENKNKPIRGTVKAMIPLMREKFQLLYE